MFQKIWVSKKNNNNRAVSRFSVEIFCATLMKTSWGNPSVFQKCSDIIEILDNKGTTILSNFLASQWQIILWGTLLCFRNFVVRKETWIGGGGLSRSSMGNFLCHNAEKNRWKTPRCFRDPRVSKRPIHKVEFTIHRWKRFCLIPPKNFVRDPSLFDAISSIEKIFAWGKCHNFQSRGG